MRGLVHHIDLTVTDPSVSFLLYDGFLTFLGYERTREYEWSLATGSGLSSICLNPAKGEGTHDRYKPGLHHLAFRAESREDVDLFYAHLEFLGATILDAPADYPQYNNGQGYYAVFFADIDSLKLEVAYTPN